MKKEYILYRVNKGTVERRTFALLDEGYELIQIDYFKVEGVKENMVLSNRCPCKEELKKSVFRLTYSMKIEDMNYKSTAINEWHRLLSEGIISHNTPIYNEAVYVQ